MRMEYPSKVSQPLNKQDKKCLKGERGLKFRKQFIYGRHFSLGHLYCTMVSYFANDQMPKTKRCSHTELKSTLKTLSY